MCTLSKFVNVRIAHGRLKRGGGVMVEGNKGIIQGMTFHFFLTQAFLYWLTILLPNQHRAALINRIQNVARWWVRKQLTRIRSIHRSKLVHRKTTTCFYRSQIERWKKSPRQKHGEVSRRHWKNIPPFHTSLFLSSSTIDSFPFLFFPFHITHA